MTRQAKDTDFIVPVPDVGSFTFGKRTMGDEIAIQVQFAKMIDGVEQPTMWLQTVCGWLAVLRVLMVRHPDSFDMDDLDPQDDATYAKLAKVHDALITKERSFRRPKNSAGEGDGTGSVQDT